MAKKLVVLTRDRTTDTYPEGHQFQIDDDGEGYLNIYDGSRQVSRRSQLVAIYTRHHWTAARYVEAEVAK